MSYATPEQLKASPEYQALGILGRERLLHEHFPELKEAERRSAADNVNQRVYGLKPQRKESQ